jgi:hypothetical protein
LPHPARADFRDQFVVTELRAGTQHSWMEWRMVANEAERGVSY